MRLGIGAWVSLCAHGVGLAATFVAIVLFDVRGCLPTANAEMSADSPAPLEADAYEEQLDEVVVELEPPKVVLDEAPGPEASPEPEPPAPVPPVAQKLAAIEVAQKLAAIGEIDAGLLEALSGPPVGQSALLGELEGDMAVLGVLRASDLDDVAALDNVARIGVADLDSPFSARGLDTGPGEGGGAPGGIGTLGSGAGDLATLGIGRVGSGSTRLSAKTRKPELSFGAARAEGGLAEGTVRRIAARAARAAIGKCTPDGDARDAHITGRLVLDLTIDEQGIATATSVPDRPRHRGTTLTDATLIQCIRQAIEHAPFGTADAETTARLELSFR